MTKAIIGFSAILVGMSSQVQAQHAAGLAPACQAAAQNIPKTCGAFAGRAGGMTPAQAACFQREAAKAQAICGMKDGRIVDRSKFGATQAPDLTYRSDRAR